MDVTCGSSAVILIQGSVKGNLAPDLCLAGLLHSHFCILFSFLCFISNVFLPPLRSL